METTKKEIDTATEKAWECWEKVKDMDLKTMDYAFYILNQLKYEKQNAHWVAQTPVSTGVGTSIYSATPLRGN
jgi:hypothetical protein